MTSTENATPPAGLESVAQRLRGSRSALAELMRVPTDPDEVGTRLGVVVKDLDAVLAELHAAIAMPPARQHSRSQPSQSPSVNESYEIAGFARALRGDTEAKPSRPEISGPKAY